MEIIGNIEGLFVILKQIFRQMFRQGFPCLFQLVTGFYCPGCGGTRAVWALLHGRVLLSLRYHPLVLYMAVVVSVELASWLLARVRKNPRWYLGHEIFFICVGGAIVLVNWIFKNYMLAVKGIDLLRL